MEKQNLIKKGISVLLSAAVVMGIVPALSKPMVAYADAENQTTSTVYPMNIGTTPLYANTNTRWNPTDGVKVYFGTYNDTPTAFRILSATLDTQEVPEDSILLDCDTTLLDKAYNECKNEGQRWLAEWKYSDLEVWLNGDNYYENASAFTTTERGAIQNTNFLESINYKINGQNFSDDASSDHIFLLSAKEADTLYENDNARRKVDDFQGWWLRSRVDGNGRYVGFISSFVGNQYIPDEIGRISWILAYESDVEYLGTRIGVSPALNLKTSSVFFTSASTADKTVALTADSVNLSENAYTGDKIWKLTLKDDGNNGSNKKTVKITDGQSVEITAKGVINVPYTYTDTATTEAEKVNQISVMITDKAYTEADARIQYYGALQNIKDTNGANSTVANSTTGTGTFVFPEALQDKTLGSDYHVYILAEHVNSGNACDYASAPLEIKSIVPMKYTITANAGNGGSISPSGAIEVMDEGNQTFAITPNDGYEIDTVTVDGSVVNSAASYNFKKVKANHTISVTFKQKQIPTPPTPTEPTTPTEPRTPTDYKIIDGADGQWVLNSDGGLSIRGNGELSKFTGVKVDGKLLDVNNYTVKEGSTIITLKADYLNTLSEGSHTFEIMWTDGSASTTLNISKNVSGSAGKNNVDNKKQSDVTGQNKDTTVKGPKTGDSSNIVLCMTLLFVSLAGLYRMNRRKI